MWPASRTIWLSWCPNVELFWVLLRWWPRAGYVFVRIDPLHTLARCHTSRLNQALSVLFLSVCLLCCYLGPLFRCVILCYLCVLSLGCSASRCQYQCKWLSGKTRLENDLQYVDGDIKPYSLTRPHFSDCDSWNSYDVQVICI